MHANSSRPALTLCVGISCLDAIIRPAEVTLAPCWLSLVKRGGEGLAIPYEGETIAWNEKRDATGDLSWLLPHADDVQPGGGGPNSALHLGRTGRPAVLLDEVDSAAASQAAAALGVAYHPVAPGRASRVNGVICAHDARRVIVRGDMPLDENRDRVQPVSIGARPGAVLINSARDIGLIDAVISEAEAAGVPVISVATSALPLPERIALLMARSTVTLTNLAEFSEIAGFAGIACPRDEETADLDDVADGMRAVQRAMPCGHLVVTMGRRNCLALDAEIGSVIHTGLARHRQEEFGRLLHQRTGGVNGAGDIFAAELAAALARQPARLAPGGIFHAAQQATREVLAALCPGCHLKSADVGWSFVEPRARVAPRPRVTAPFPAFA